MTVDIEKLEALAKAATPGRVHNRLDSCGGGLKYECFGDDGSLVLKVDHKNDEWGFVGERGEQDEAFFLGCTPAAVLELIGLYKSARDRKNSITALKAENAGLKTGYEAFERVNAELRAENEKLRKDAERFRHLMFNHVDWARNGKDDDQVVLEFGPYPSHKLRATIDAAMRKEQSHD